MKKSITAAQVSGAAKRKKKIGYKLFFCVLPGIILVFLFEFLPLWGWSFAFFQYRPARQLLDCDFVGWDNFTNLFANAVMRKNLFRVLRNTFGMHLLGYLFSPLPMLFAVLLSEVRFPKFQKAIQTLTTLPHFVSWVIVLSLAVSILGANGPVNTMLKDAGAETINVLNTDKHVWLTQVLLGQWKGLGWSAIVYFSAIAGIDQGLLEAAMVDGAGRWQKIRYIILPLLIPTYFVLLIMSIGNFLNTGIDQYMAFGNALNKEYIETLDLYVYNLGIGSGQISFSVAVGIMKSVVAIAMFASANWVSKKIRGTSVF